MIITFGFLVLYTAVQPYCTPGLSKTQACSLIAQFISLFSGLCLVLESYVLQDLISAGENDSTKQSIEIFGVLILVFNLLVLTWPVINVLMSAEFAEKVDRLFKKIKAILKNKQPITDSGGSPGISQQEGNLRADFNCFDAENRPGGVRTKDARADVVEIDPSYVSVLDGTLATGSTGADLLCPAPFSSEEAHLNRCGGAGASVAGTMMREAPI
jgi:hypothetical protein